MLAAHDVEFTDRQLEVAHLIERGLTNLEAGRELGVSPRTVKHHCDLMRRKLGVPKRRLIPAALRDRGVDL